jgi:hypothetical protein
MAADFGIDVELIPEEALRAEINKIQQCLRDSGIEIEIDIDEPGLGSLIATLIKAIEKAIIAAYEPIIALVNIVTEAIEAGVNAVSVFLEKIQKVINAIAELVSNFPQSIIEFIINKIVEPIAKYINIPFPSISGILEIILGRVKLVDIDWEKWLAEGKLIVPEKLKAKGEEKVKQVLTLFQSFNGLQAAFLKLLELLLFPIKFAIKAIEGIVRKVQQLVTNLFKAINEIVEIVSNPVQYVLEFIAEIFAIVLTPIVESIAGKIEDIELFIAKFKELIASIFQIGAVKIDIEKWIEALPPGLRAVFKQISNFIKIIQCFIFWIVGLLNVQTILRMFGLTNFKFPPVKFSSYIERQKRLFSSTTSPEDLISMFKVGDKITVQLEGDTKIYNATIKSVGDVDATGRLSPSVIVEEELFSKNVDGVIKVTKVLNYL